MRNQGLVSARCRCWISTAFIALEKLLPLTLTKERIFGMADGLTQLAALEDPIGEVLSMKKRPNGLLIGQKRVPIGVVGMIYEARPNVTADAFGLWFQNVCSSGK